MKKCILFMVLGLAFLGGMAQTEVYRGQLTTVVDSLAPATISGTDTTIYVKMPATFSPTWMATVTWSTITGSGTCALVTSYKGVLWEAYTGSPSVTLTGANNTYKYEDYMFSDVYLGFKITKGTISAGKVVVKILVR